MSTHDEGYRSYLLRLRYVANGGHAVWVYSLETPDGVERHEFRTLQALTDYLALQSPTGGGGGRKEDGGANTKD